MKILIIIIVYIGCLLLGGWLGQQKCRDWRDEVRVLRRKIYEAEEQKEKLLDTIAELHGNPFRKELMPKE